MPRREDFKKSLIPLPPKLFDQLKAVFELSSDGIWLSDANGNVLDINKTSETLLGVKKTDVVGRNMRTLIKQGLIDHSATLKVLEEKRRVHLMQYVRKTGKWLLLTGTPVFNEKGAICLVVVNERDITQLNELKGQLDESRRLTDKFQDELAELTMRDLKELNVISGSQAMERILKLTLKLAHLGVSKILILGESGTGKGLLAKTIHQAGRRKDKPFIQINFAALPENLIEAELFGYEEGAFTGAAKAGKAGLFQLADQGTLFLDEIGDASLSTQAKILKYLDDQEVWKLGATQPQKVDCTILAATNRDMDRLVREGRFRKDLYYRLSSFQVQIPPLRERPEDIFELTKHFLARFNREFAQNKQISATGMEALTRESWPGNVRQLESRIKEGVVLSTSTLIDDYLIKPAENRDKHVRTGSQGLSTLEEELNKAEKAILAEAQTRCRTTREMARLLGVSQATISRKLRQHGLS